MKLKESIYIIGEGHTEKYYFQHLKNLQSYQCIVRPRLFQKNSIHYIETATEKLLLGDVIVICVFDADVSSRNKQEGIKLKRFKSKYRDNKNVIICDSLPSIEFWFLLHFKKTNRYFNGYSEIKKELRKYISDYDKTEKYLKQNKWVKVLIRKQTEAVKNARETKSTCDSYSNIYKAMDVLEKRS